MNTMRPSRVGLRHRVAGVTLIELMIVVVVVAILGAIAIPSYRQYSLRSQRTEAKTALLRVATNQERIYLQNRSYSPDLTELGFGAAADAPTEEGRYVLNVTAADVQTYTVRATAANEMTTDAECQWFEVNAQGVRTAGPDPNGNCW